jgi:class 3 adenylate cyclase/tetratricopeptide (TPR) repeat protein
VETIACPSCGEENPSKFRLCGFCGTALVTVPETVTCAACGEENPSKFRLCGFCGTPLAAASGTAAVSSAAAGAETPAVTMPAPATPSPPPRARIAALPAQEVRKFVTLVFTDLKDSTALTGSIDNEAMNEIKARYFRSMAVEIERHGGKVEKNIGDAIMAVFGLIRAHEDDALRAVRAAHGMQRALADLNDALLRDYGVQITCRTGVNTGEIVANTDPSADQNLATGDAVNVAARLEQNAPAGEILLGEVTYALVRANVDVERLELQLKGKPEPVPAYRLLAVHDAVDAPPASAPRFVGRQAETDVLRRAFAAVAANRSVRLVTVVGDAGVGKTRLIADFVASVSKEANVFRGRCLAYGDGITFWPLIEIVRSAARIGEDDSQEVARSRIAALVPETDRDREAIVDRVASAVGLSSSSYPVAELFWGGRRLLEAQATDRPLVIVVDDIHSAEETFLEFLTHVVGTTLDAPVLIVCSARPELVELHADWVEAAGGERIDLQPLASTDVEAMIVGLLAGVAVSPETREKVVAAAEGNPLYIEQMVSMLREHGDESGDVVVPPTIAALLAARLDALTREERAVVDPAAVIGLVFAAAAIEHLVPDVIRETVDEHLAALDRKQFVHPLTADAEDPAFRFHHILVRDAAYQSLLKRARATLHERFVEWAEPVNRDRGRETEFEEILGYHLEQAVRYRSELGPLDEQGRMIGARAAAKLASAGRRAFGRGDTPAACSLLRRAVALLTTDDPVRHDLQGDLADALMEEGQFEEARAVVEEMAEIAERLGDDRLRARAELGLRGLQLHISEIAGVDRVIADTLRAIDVFVGTGDEAGLARAWQILMIIHGTTGAYDRASEAARQIIEHANAAGDPRRAARGAMGYATTALLGPTPVGEALAVCEKLIDDVRGDRRAESVVLGVLAQLHAMRGEFDEARTLYRRAATLLADLGRSVTAATLSTESSRVEALAGDFEAAERELRRDDAALEAMGERYYRSTVDGLLAQVLAVNGRLEEAAAFSETAEALADPDDVSSHVFWRTARARVFARTNRKADAERLAREAVELAMGTVDVCLHAGALVDLADVLELEGRPNEAGPPLREALALYERKEDVVSAGRVRSRLRELAPA